MKKLVYQNKSTPLPKLNVFRVNHSPVFHNHLYCANLSNGSLGKFVMYKPDPGQWAFITDINITEAYLN